MKRIIILFIAAIFLASFGISNSQAFAMDTRFYSGNDIIFYDPDATACGTTQNTAVVSTGNTDYAGNTILSQAELDGIAANKSVYEAAGKVSGTPWQAIAVLHLRETRLGLVNPSNGQGLYQDSKNLGGTYPPGAVSQEDFLRQSTWAGTFLKGKASNPELFATGDAGQVKDAFFGYNGRSSQYETQAKKLGFTEGYDGSPYVVNKIDAKRDPTTNPAEWGQIKNDGGSISYPANSDYGAFVVYASLAGIKSSNCGSTTASGDLNAKMVQFAQAELKLWTDGTMKPGSDYKKYTYGSEGDWCAWFVSYILKEAGHPVDTTDTPDWPSVRTYLEQSSTIGFVTHPAGDGYKPKAGDLALYDGHTHINIVTGYSDTGKMLTIGGNQGAGENGNFTNSKVSQNTGYGESATSYVEVK